MSASSDYDTGPLNWVRGDIDAALQAALGRIQAYGADADLTNALRLARDDAHQVAGVLRMVGLEGASTLAGTIEACLVDINENRLAADDRIMRAVMNALEGLQRWVRELAEGRGSGELALFPLYKSLRLIMGAERVFEGELFFPDLRIQAGRKEETGTLSQDALMATVKSARAAFQRGLLGFLRNTQAEQGLVRMRDALVAVERVAPSQASRTFWWASVGFVDSLIAHGVEADFNVKQLLARIDLQMRRLMEGSPQVAERLLRDALFFVAKSGAMDGRAAEVRARLGLDRYLPGRGLIDPETLASMRPVLQALRSGVGHARDSWRAVVEGDATQLETFCGQMEAMQPQARMFPESGLGALLSVLAEAAGQSPSQTGAGRDQANLEIAATLLFLQNAIEREEILHSDFSGRATGQQQRLNALLAGEALPAVDVECAAQRESERDMLTQLAQEVGQNLRHMEEALDAFFRDENAREDLQTLPGLAGQAQGALTMLEQPEAAQLLRAATELAQVYTEQGYPDAATQHRLADAFSSLGLFIEAYCAGRADAARILQPALIDFDIVEAESENDADFSDTVESGLPARKAAALEAYQGWRETADDASAKKKSIDAFVELQRDAELIDDALLLQQARTVLDLCNAEVNTTHLIDEAVVTLTGLALPLATLPAAHEEETCTAPAEARTVDQLPSDTEVILAPDAHRPSTAAGVLTETVPEPAALPGTGAAVTEGFSVHLPDEVEPELLEIFLEEAKEVLATMGEAVEAARVGEDEALAVIRRGFHTLKGSGRMVNLNALGEAAWRHEQLLNGWLADRKPASEALLQLVGSARELFGQWVMALQTATPVELPLSAQLAALDRVEAGEAGSLPLHDAQRAGAAPEAAIETGVEPEAAAAPVSHDEAAALDAPQFAESDPGMTCMEPVPHVAASAAYQAVIEKAVPVWHALIEYAVPVRVTPCPEAAFTTIVEYASPPVPETAAADTNEPESALPVYGCLIEYAYPPEPVVATIPEIEEICIGTICLSPSLYEVFMTETRQRIEVLDEEIERLIELDGGLVSEPARRAVHTLAGIAGTAGIGALSELAHAFELYWNGFSHVPLPSAHLPLSREVVGRIGEMRTLLEQQCLPDAASDLLVAMDELGAAQNAQTETPRQPEGDRVETVPAPADTPEMDASAALLADISALIPEIKPAMPIPVFERREVTDEIDSQLLPIFLEESETLVPDTSAQLRAWRVAPADATVRDALRRNLHTLKGSARMVGAMRLGELTHVMESRVIAVVEGQIAADDAVFDTLETQMDRLSETVEHLRRGEPDNDSVPASAVSDEPLVTAPSPVAAVIPHDPFVPAQPVSREASALTLRVRADWVDRMVNQAGEVAIARSRIESEVFAFKRHVTELSDALSRLRGHIREVEIQAETQMQATFQTRGATEEFDPLEFDRFTRFQEVTRFLAESVNDISTVQHILLARLGEADAALIQQTRLNRELQQDLLRVRMVPLYSVAERLYRTVRQSSRDVGKRAQLDIQGGELEIDRSVLEKVTAPIEHLLRNALAHGIEDADTRRAAGKAEFGEIVLAARQTGNEMLLTVQDDGRGLDYVRIREKAEAAGLLLPGAEPTETLLAQMIFTAGLSTADTVTEVSGRGVGMDVVKSEISALGGRIETSSSRGAGTRFDIYLPLTLAVTQAVMVQAAKHDYALPAPLVQQVIELKPDELAQTMARGEIDWRGARYPFAYLPHLLGDVEAVHEVQRYNPVVLLHSGASLAAVLVDSIEGTREIVVKNIGPQMARITGVAGATVRGDGRVILILNPVPLALRWASQPRATVEASVPTETVEVGAALQPPMVLVVDDSLTVRKITTRLLTREGFRVDSAKDGVDALEKMHDLVPDVVLLDVEMPRMDGFELARVMRASPRLKTVPIIMITSRTADKHRNHALEIGVNVYLGKPYQEQQLLDHIAEQLGDKAFQPV